MAERRGFERIEYASGTRPTFVLGGRSFDVVDCAERGLRFLATGVTAPSVGSEVRGVVRFPGGREVPVEGVVVRAGVGDIAVNFTRLWIDKEVIEGERRRLRGPGSHAT